MNVVVIRQTEPIWIEIDHEIIAGMSRLSVILEKTVVCFYSDLFIYLVLLLYKLDTIQ